MCLWHSYGPRLPDPPFCIFDSLAEQGLAFVLRLGKKEGTEDEQKNKGCEQAATIKWKWPEKERNKKTKRKTLWPIHFTRHVGETHHH